MRDRPQIIAGLLVFLVLFTFPIWRGRARNTSTLAPSIPLPTQHKQCVAPLRYMRDSHMQLLLDWREQVVRDGERWFTAPDGKVYEKSLTRTCLAQCHTSKTEFCDRCHLYAGVSGPYCWDCHNDTRVTVAARSVP